MITVKARSAAGPRDRFVPTIVERRDLGPADVLIDIAYAGICHSDVHHARADWGHTLYPIVPGHEIAGVISAVGPEVTLHAVGDRVGVGCLIDSCGKCQNCRTGMQQYCTTGNTLTYGSIDRFGQPTLGGYSQKIVVDQRFVLHVPDALELSEAAPLMCGGITLYSPLRHWRAGPGKRVGIVGMGGLGHVGVQLSHALGAHTTVFNQSPDREQDAREMGADDYRLTTEASAFAGLADSFDLIISTVPAKPDLDTYLGLLRLDGTFVNLGVPSVPIDFTAHALLQNRRSISGSLIGSLAETQEMLEFCAGRGCRSRIEIVTADEIDVSYDRLAAGDVRYRFVIDIATLV